LNVWDRGSVGGAAAFKREVFLNVFKNTSLLKVQAINRLLVKCIALHPPPLTIQNDILNLYNKCIYPFRKKCYYHDFFIHFKKWNNVIYVFKSLKNVIILYVRWKLFSRQLSGAFTYCFF